MPGWGWVCVGLAAAGLLAFVGLVVVLLLPDKRRERLLREGKTVVAHVVLASPELYDAASHSPFGFGLVVFTLEGDDSPEHLGYLSSIASRLADCTDSPTADADEQRIARALQQQVTIGPTPRRIPSRLTDGRTVYFATPSIMRRHLADSCLVRDYIYLKVIAEGEHAGLTMIEEPPKVHPRG